MFRDAGLGDGGGLTGMDLTDSEEDVKELVRDNSGLILDSLSIYDI